jgi:hypothetical protein
MSVWKAWCASLLLPLTVLAAEWPPGACSVCLRFLDEGEVSFRAVDQVEQMEREVCARCATQPELCFLCGLPTREDRKTLSDGRYYCARDAGRAVFSGEEIRRHCGELLDRVQRSLARFMTFPAERIEWEVEDLTQRSHGLAEGEVRCRHAATRFMARRDGDGMMRYTVLLLNGLPEAWLSAAAAHGLAHAWLLEHVPQERRLTSGAVEGFCEWIAWHALEATGQQGQAERLRLVDLAQGQLEVFLEADRVYDMFRILEWVRFGVDDRLVSGDTDRVRRLDDRLQPVRHEPRQVIPPSPAPVRGPEELVLRGILGTGNRRLALINNVSLGLGESGGAVVGTNLYRLKCVGLGDDWAEVEVEGSADRRVLRIGAAQGRQ